MLKQYAGRTEQWKAAIHRKADATELVEDGELHTRGAMYLAGYAIECRIKAIAMECFGCSTLDELRHKRGLFDDAVYSHGLEALMRDLLPQGTWSRLLASDASTAFKGQVSRWSPQWRYNSQNPPKDQAHEFLDAIEVVWQWLGANV